MASRARVSRLKSVDLPTLGRPTMTTIGIIPRSLQADCKNAAVARLHEYGVVIQRNRRRADRAPIGRYACGERAILTRKEMHVALKIPDHHEAAERERRAYPASRELVLFPQASAVCLVERYHCVLVVCNVRTSMVGVHAGYARHIA